MFQGQATDFLTGMSKTQEFLLATDGSIKSDRMLDCEFCLRYVAFTKLLEKYNGNMDTFLSEGMEYLQNADEKTLSSIITNFKKNMNTSYTIFRRDCFRKAFDDGRRRPINKAIFEAISVVIFNSTEEEINSYIKNNEMIKEKFIKLCSDYDFQNNLKASDKISVSSRIKKISGIFNKNMEV